MTNESLKITGNLRQSVFFKTAKLVLGYYAMDKQTLKNRHIRAHYDIFMTANKLVYFSPIPISASIEDRNIFVVKFSNHLTRYYATWSRRTYQD